MKNLRGFSVMLDKDEYILRVRALMNRGLNKKRANMIALNEFTEKEEKSKKETKKSKKE